MADLFSNQEESKRTYTRASKGRFASKQESELFNTKAERDRLKTTAEYYKRQCERLSDDCLHLKTRNKELEQLLKSRSDEKN